MGILDGIMSKGLLGMGGVQGAMGGNGVPQGLLEAGYDPAQLRKMQIKRALLQGGAAMMAQGPSQYPISFAQQLGTGLSAGLLGADQAREDYTNQTLLGVKLQDQKAERARQAKQDAWTNTANARQMSEWDEQDAAKKQKRDFLTKTLMSPLTGVPVQNMGQANMYRQMGDYDAAAQALMAQPEQAKPTDDMREYQYSQQDPRFADYLAAQKRAGAPQTNIDMKADTAFATESAKVQAKRYGDLLTEGENANQMLGNINALREIGANIGTGKTAEVTAALGPYAEAIGLSIDGLGEMQAYEAIVAKIAPSLRTPGVGAMSDYELKQFVKALPGLGKTPEGNQVIQATLESVAQHKMAAAQIASQVLNEEITRAEGEKQLRALPDPWTMWKQNKGKFSNIIDGGLGGQTSSGVQWKLRTK